MRSTDGCGAGRLSFTDLRRTLLTRESPQRGDHIEIDGRTLANFGSNDYLGLACDERLRRVAIESVENCGRCATVDILRRSFALLAGVDLAFEIIQSLFDETEKTAAIDLQVE